MQNETHQFANYPHYTLAVITVSGSATIVYNNLPEFGSLANTTRGTFAQDGWFNGWSWDGQCSGNVSWAFSVEGYRYVCYYDNWGAPRVYTDTMVVKGTGVFTWHRGYLGEWWATCGGSGEPPCFLVSSGSFAIDVQPIPADLMLTASATSVTPSTNVTFTASATPAAVNADWRLFTIQSWQWTPDSGSQTVSCGTSKTCNFTPLTSGTMKVTAIVNGTEQTEERYVSVLPCLTGDTVLDDARIRRELEKAWNGSNATGPQSGKVERFGGRFGSTDTTFAPLPGSSACRGWDPAQWQVGTPIGALGYPGVMWHTHPWNKGDSRQSSSICPERGPANPNTTFDPDVLSFTDIDFGSGVPMIVVTSSNVYLYYYDTVNNRYGTTAGKLTPNVAVSRVSCDVASI
jgi:hypothetical protein